MQQIVIIGATSAIASKLAKHHSDAGDQLILIGRNQKKLNALEKHLGNSVVKAISADFMAMDQADKLVDEIKQAFAYIDIVWIVHGDLGDQIRSEQDFTQAKHTLDLNFLSIVALLIPLSQWMQDQAQPHNRKSKIGVIGSVAGDRGRPRNFTYGAAKSGLNTYLQGLRSVNYHKGIEVYSFKLGPVDTPMTINHEKNFSFSSADRVAEQLYRGINKKCYTQYVPGYWRLVMFVVRHMPEWLFQRLGFLSGR